MRALSRFIDLRRGEGPLALRTFLILLGLVAGHTVLETARDALFLGTLEASRLAFVYVALAVVGLVVPGYNERLARALGRRNALVATLVIAAFGTIVWHFRPATAATAYGIYLWSGLLGTVMVVQFWMVAAQLFTMPQGKRLFGGIAAGGVLGAVLGGALATGALLLLPRHDGAPDVRALLLVTAGLFLVTAGIVTTVPGEDAVAVPTAPARAGLSGLRILRENPYVVRLALLAVASTAAVLATDYLFKFVAKGQVPRAELAPFFARYYTVLNGAALVVQLFIARYLLQRLGIVVAAAVLPVLLLAGGTSLVALGAPLALILLTKGADGALRHSLHRVGTELLYLPLPAHLRDRAKALLDAVLVRATQALVAGALLLLALLELQSPRLLGAVVAVLAALWCVAVLALRGPYLDLFRRKLSRGTVDASLLASGELDIAAVESLMAALSSPDPARVVAAIDLLVDIGRAKLIPALVLYHESEQVILRALEVVAQTGREWRPHGERLLRHESVAVRAAAVRAFGRAREDAVLRRALDDASPTVRAHAAFQLAQLDAAERPLRHPAIAALLEQSRHAPAAERDELRIGLLDALKEDADARWADVLLELSDSEVPSVIERVALAMARVQDPRFVPVLVRRLAVRQGRAAVREALAALGDPAFDALERALHDPATPPALRLHIPRTLSRFATQRAADVLVELLASERDGAVRYKALRGLGRVAENRSVRVQKAPIERELLKNLSEHLRLLSLWLPVHQHEPPPRAHGSARLLAGLLEDKMLQAVERAFRLFHVLNPKEDVRGIFAALQSRDARVRANALEFLDTLALGSSDACRELLRLVADDLSPEERVRRAGAHIPAPPSDARGVILSLLDESDDSIVALAAYHGRCWGERRVIEAVDDLCRERPELGYVTAAAAALVDRESVEHAS